VNLSGENIPSLSVDIMSILKKSAIKNAVRYSWWPPKESTDECDIQDSDVFSYTEGPLLVYMESGEVVGFSSDESKNSIVVWLEKDADGNIHEEDIENDNELFPISYNEKSYSGGVWNTIAGRRIVKVTLIKRSPQTVKYEDLPNEVGVLLTIENGSEFYLCHQLCGKSTNFSATDKNGLEEKLLDQLSFMEI